MINFDTRDSKTGIRRFVFTVDNADLTAKLLEGLREVGAKNIQHRIAGWNTYQKGEIKSKEIINLVSCNQLTSKQVDLLTRKEIEMNAYFDYSHNREISADEREDEHKFCDVQKIEVDGEYPEY